MIFIDVQIPVSLIDIANSIARAIDPDVGGAETFRVPEDYEGDTLITGLPFFDDFAEKVPRLFASPRLLHKIVADDYAERWQDLAPPTLAEVTIFCSSVMIIDPPKSEIVDAMVIR